MNFPPKKSFSPFRQRFLACGRRTLRRSVGVGVAALSLGIFASRAHADAYQFTNGSTDGLYLTGANWTDTTTGTTGTVPNLTTANSAQINDGVNVNYVPGGRLAHRWRRHT